MFVEVGGISKPSIALQKSLSRRRPYVPFMHVDTCLFQQKACKCNATKVTFTVTFNQFCTFSSKTSDDRGVAKAPGHSSLVLLGAIISSYKEPFGTPASKSSPPKSYNVCAARNSDSLALVYLLPCVTPRTN